MSSDRPVGSTAAYPSTAPTAVPVAAPPPVLGNRYELGPRIGGGGSATVYRARDLVLGRSVAVKVMRSDGQPEDADRFDQEARLLAALSHPGLVTVFDAGSSVDGRGDPQAYLVMELVDGTTLGARLRGGPLSARETADIGRQLAAALAYVHGQGVVHRDVKPANVLLTAPISDRASVAKLTDFGIARLVDSDRMTMQGFTVGTANYLSPEQATGDDVGPASDVYSLGLVLLECLTGDVVYPGQGVAAASARLHRQPTLPAWLSPEWAALITAMTQREPADRIAAGAAAAELGRLRALDSAPQPTAVLPVVAPVSVPAVAGDRMASAGRRARGALAAALAGVGATLARYRRRPGWFAAGVAAAAVLVIGVTAALTMGPVGPPSSGRPAPVSTSNSAPTQPQAVVARSTTPAPTTKAPTTTHAVVTHAPVKKAPAPAPRPPKHHKHGG